MTDEQLNQLQSMFRAAFEPLAKRLEEHNAYWDRVEEKIDQMALGLDRLEQGLNGLETGMNSKLDKIDALLISMSAKLDYQDELVGRIERNSSDDARCAIHPSEIVHVIWH